MKNTKKEILDALNEAENRIAEKKLSAANPASMAKEQKIEKTLARSSTVVNGSRINEFRKDMTSTLTDLTTRLESLLEDLASVESSIQIKRDELKNLFDIEASANTLTALADTQIELKSQHEEKMREISDNFKAEKENILNEHQERLNVIKKEIEETKRQAELERERQTEEWDYEFTQRTRRKTQELQDNLDVIRKETYSQLDEREQSVSSRESKMDELEETNSDLQSQVDEIPQVVADRVKSEVGRERGILENRFKNQSEVLELKFQNQLDQATNNAKILEDSNKELRQQIDTLTTKLDNAYQELRSLASDTVKASSGNNGLEAIKEAILSGNKVYKH